GGEVHDQGARRRRQHRSRRGGTRMIEISIEGAYAEACRTLGEATVRERLLVAEIQRLSAAIPEAEARGRQQAAEAIRAAADGARERRAHSVAARYREAADIARGPDRGY